MNLKVQLLSTGVVTSQNYPCNYPNKLNTTETISVKEGEVVVIEFTAFNTEGSDNLEIRDGDGTILMEERSGECLPGKIWSRTNIVHLHFYTHRWSDTRTGWSANWTASMPTGEEQFHLINKSNQDFEKRIDEVYGINQ